MLAQLHAFLEDPALVVALCEQYARGYLRARITDEQTRTAWMHAFDEGYSQQADQLGPVVQAVWDELETGGSLNDTLDAYRQGLVSVRHRLLVLQQQGRLHHETAPLETQTAALMAILPNYLHMTNNRLGITIPEEAYLAHLIKQSLGRHMPQPLS